MLLVVTYARKRNMIQINATAPAIGLSVDFLTIQAWSEANALLIGRFVVLFIDGIKANKDAEEKAKDKLHGVNEQSSG